MCFLLASLFCGGGGGGCFEEMIGKLDNLKTKGKGKLDNSNPS